MFRKPLEGNPKEHMAEENFEYAQSFLARERRILFLRGAIQGIGNRSDQFSPMAIGDDIMAMNVDDPTKPIYLVIDSPGGEISTGFVLYDTIRMSVAPIVTIGASCASMATFLLAAGTTRLAFPHARFMLHLPQGMMGGDPKEMKIHSKEFSRLRDDLVQSYVTCGVTAGLKSKSPEAIGRKILKDIDRIFYLDAEGAVKYGLCDRIIEAKDLFGDE